MRLSLVDRLRLLKAEDRKRILAGCTAEELAALKFEFFRFWARPDEREAGGIMGTGQVPPPGDWQWWICQGGRGSGKSTAAAWWALEEGHRLGKGCVFVFQAQTVDDARKIMVDGENGIMTHAAPWHGLDFKPSVEGGMLTWRSGAVAYLYGADKPGKGRGPNFNRWWVDDPVAWGVNGKRVFDALYLGFRLQTPDGSPTRGVVATTPPGDPPPPCPELVQFFLDPQHDPTNRGQFVYSTSASDDNLANLTPDFVRTLDTMFAGSPYEVIERGGRYEKGGEAKTFQEFDFGRPPIRIYTAPDRFVAICVSIDPADSSSTRRCEVGIVASGLTAESVVHLEDASGHLTADEWPNRAHDLLERWAPAAHGNARFIVEVNRGTKDSALLRSAEMIRRMARGLPGISVVEIRHVTSTDKKGDRAAPLVQLYRQGKIQHVPGLVELERQLHRLSNTSKVKADRADAAVYAALDLLGLIDPSRPAMLGASALGASSHESLGARPLAAVAVGPAPRSEQRIVSASPFQVAPGVLFGNRR